MEGNLYKKSSGMLSKWQKRWFRLENFELKYYADDKTTVSKDIFDLHTMVSLKEKFEGKDTKGFWVIILELKDRVLELKCDSEIDKIRWVNLLEVFQDIKGSIKMPNCVRDGMLSCLNYIEAEGLFTEGIFRLAGTVEDVNTMLFRFYSGDYTIERGTDVNCVTSALKKMLCDMPETILTNKYYRNMLAPNMSYEEVKNIVKKLPESNFDVLAKLFNVFHAIAFTNKGYTHISVENLASLFGRCFVKKETPNDIPGLFELFSLMCKNRDLIFHKPEKNTQWNEIETKKESKADATESIVSLSEGMIETTTSAKVQEREAEENKKKKMQFKTADWDKPRPEAKKVEIPIVDAEAFKDFDDDFDGSLDLDVFTESVEDDQPKEIEKKKTTVTDNNNNNNNHNNNNNKRASTFTADLLAKNSHLDKNEFGLSDDDSDYETSMEPQESQIRETTTSSNIDTSTKSTPKQVVVTPTLDSIQDETDEEDLFSEYDKSLGLQKKSNTNLDSLYSMGQTSLGLTEGLTEADLETAQLLDGDDDDLVTADQKDDDEDDVNFDDWEMSLENEDVNGVLNDKPKKRDSDAIELDKVTDLSEFTDPGDKILQSKEKGREDAMKVIAAIEAEEQERMKKEEEKNKKKQEKDHTEGLFTENDNELFTANDDILKTTDLVSLDVTDVDLTANDDYSLNDDMDTNQSLSPSKHSSSHLMTQEQTIPEETPKKKEVQEKQQDQQPIMDDNKKIMSPIKDDSMMDKETDDFDFGSLAGSFDDSIDLDVYDEPSPKNTPSQMNKSITQQQQHTTAITTPEVVVTTQSTPIKEEIAIKPIVKEDNNSVKKEDSPKSTKVLEKDESSSIGTRETPFDFDQLELDIEIDEDHYVEQKKTPPSAQIVDEKLQSQQQQEQVASQQQQEQEQVQQQSPSKNNVSNMKPSFDLDLGLDDSDLSTANASVESASLDLDRPTPAESIPIERQDKRVQHKEHNDNNTVASAPVEDMNIKKHDSHTVISAPAGVHYMNNNDESDVENEKETRENELRDRIKTLELNQLHERNLKRRKEEELKGRIRALEEKLNSESSSADKNLRAELEAQFQIRLQNRLEEQEMEFNKYKQLSETEMKGLRTVIKRTENDLEATQMMSSKQTTDASQLHNEIDDLKSKLMTTEMRLANSQVQCEELMKKNIEGDAETEKRPTKGQLREAELRAEESALLLSQLQQRVEKERKSQTQALDDFRLKIIGVQAERDQLREEREILLEKVDQAELSLTKIQRENTRLQDESASGMMPNSGNLLEDVRDRYLVEKMTREKRELGEALDRQGSKYEERERIRQEELRQLKKQNVELRHQLLAMQGNVDRLEATIKTKSQRIDYLNTLLDTTEQEGKSKLAKMQYLQDKQNAEMKRMHISYSQEQQMLQKQVQIMNEGKAAAGTDTKILELPKTTNTNPRPNLSFKFNTSKSLLSSLSQSKKRLRNLESKARSSMEESKRILQRLEKEAEKVDFYN